MKRVNVIGTSGSGKTTLAHRIAVAIDAPVIPLDAVFHQPDWTPLPDDEFRQRVTAAIAPDRWVVDGNYSPVRGVVWGSADVIVWLDVPKLLAMWRVTHRTVLRGITKRGLWNGNHEDWRNALSTDPERNMLLWTWTTHERRRRTYAALQAGEWSHKRWIHLRTRREIERFVRAVEQAQGHVEHVGNHSP
jgi:adenylate kinase family enzyme